MPRPPRPQAERLLAIAAYLAPDRIPLGIVTADVMPEIEKGEAVAALAEVSLVTRETLDDGSPAISVHRLVQEVMRRRLGEGAAETAALATRLVADAYPSDTDPKTCATGPPAADSKPTPPPCWRLHLIPVTLSRRQVDCSINTRCTCWHARSSSEPNRLMRRAHRYR